MSRRFPRQGGAPATAAYYFPPAYRLMTDIQANHQCNKKSSPAEGDAGLLSGARLGREAARGAFKWSDVYAGGDRFEFADALAQVGDLDPATGGW